jgi:hypothetical protein
MAEALFIPIRYSDKSELPNLDKPEPKRVAFIKKVRIIEATKPLKGIKLNGLVG